MYSAGAVEMYRDDWLERVEERRARQAHRIADVATQRAIRRMTAEQARELAQRLRTLYVSFYTGVLNLRNYAAVVGQRPYSTDPLASRLAASESLLRAAMEQINTTLPQIRVEPGSQEVCDHYNDFVTSFRSYMQVLPDHYENGGFWNGWNLMSSQQQMEKATAELQAAIHEHIGEIASLS